MQGSVSAQYYSTCTVLISSNRSFRYEAFTAYTSPRWWHPYLRLLPASWRQPIGATCWVSACLDVVTSWMRANQLQLNMAKPKVILFSTSWSQFQLPTTGFLNNLGGDLIFSTWSSNFSDLIMRSQVLWTVSQCFGALCRICSMHDLHTSTCSTHWLRPWFWPDSIMAIHYPLVPLQASKVVSSRFSMQSQAW